MVKVGDRISSVCGSMCGQLQHVIQVSEKLSSVYQSHPIQAECNRGQTSL